MKKIYTFFVVLFIVGSLMAQTPQSFKYQAVARDAGGDVVDNQAVGMQISILQGSISGTAMYVETFTLTTNEFGLMNLNIGGGTVVSGDFTIIDWGADTYFMKIEMDMTGGTTYEEYGTSQLLSVPYALYAKTASTFSGNFSDLISVPVNVSIFTNDAGYLTSFTETDPVFNTSIASGITGIDTTNWNNKLDSYTETDPLFTAWDKSTGINITESQISDLDHFINADETDPNYTASQAANITATDISNLSNLSGTNTGDQDISGIEINATAIAAETARATSAEATLALKSNVLELDNTSAFTPDKDYEPATKKYVDDNTVASETDPVFGDWDKTTGINITESQISDLDHFTTADEIDPDFGAHAANGITSTNITDWNTAFGWDDHSTVGYFAAGGEAGGADRTLGNTDDFSLGFKTNNETRLIITNDGNVGIGTTGPGQELTVIGDAEVLGSAIDAAGLKFHTNYVISNTSSRILFAESNSDTYGFSWLYAGETDPTLGSTTFTGISPNKLHLLRHNSTATGDYVMTINRSDGNVGIGTTEPKSKLQVNGGIQCANDSDDASADKVGTFRYREDGVFSYLEICMRVDYWSYQWVVIETFFVMEFLGKGGL